MKKSKKKISNIWIALILFFGMGVLLYPSVSAWLSQQQAVVSMDAYTDTVAKFNQADLDEIFYKAAEYNDSLRGDPVKDPFFPGSGKAMPKNYTSVLNVDNDGVMGTLEIPLINVSLPIYHGTSETVLQKGVGHSEGTAFPVGGEGNHTVLTGHTGLPTAKLFTDLIEMDVGDRFYVRVMNREMVYEVDKISVIYPEDFGDRLNAVHDQDYLTLITCTPYGVNTQRLLVRGKRVEQITKELVFKHENTRLYFIVFLGTCALGLLLLLILLVDFLQNRKSRPKHKRARS